MEIFMGWRYRQGVYSSMRMRAATARIETREAGVRTVAAFAAAVLLLLLVLVVPPVEERGWPDPEDV